MPQIWFKSVLGCCNFSSRLLFAITFTFPAKCEQAYFSKHPFMNPPTVRGKQITSSEAIAAVTDTIKLRI